MGTAEPRPGGGRDVRSRGLGAGGGCPAARWPRLESRSSWEPCCSCAGSPACSGSGSHGWGDRSPRRPWGPWPCCSPRLRGARVAASCRWPSGSGPPRAPARSAPDRALHPRLRGDGAPGPGRGGLRARGAVAAAAPSPGTDGPTQHRRLRRGPRRGGPRARGRDAGRLPAAPRAGLGRPRLERGGGAPASGGRRRARGPRPREPRAPDHGPRGGAAHRRHALGRADLERRSLGHPPPRGAGGSPTRGKPLEPGAPTACASSAWGRRGSCSSSWRRGGGARLRVRLEISPPLDLGGLDPEELRAPNAVPSYRGDRLRAHAERTFGAWEVAAEEEGVEVPDSDGGGTGLAADEEDHGH